MKNKGYIVLICLGVMLYFYIWIGVPKIEKLTYEDYKISVEYRNNKEEEQKEEKFADNDNIDYIVLDNIEEFSNKYEGEIPLLDITNTLLENINVNIKKIKLQAEEKGINKTFSDNEELIEKSFGISELTQLEELLNKFDEITEYDIVSANVISDSCSVGNRYTTFSIKLILNNYSEIILNVSVANYAKTDEKSIQIN